MGAPTGWTATRSRRPAHARELRQRFDGGLAVLAAADDEAEGGQAVHGLELAGERIIDLVPAPQQVDDEVLAGGARRGALEADLGALAAIGQHAQPALLAQRI